MPEAREQWVSRWGFILAAVGSAIGLGNIWRFSYVAGDQGGAAFLMIYVLCIVAIGFPVMMSEFMIGRRAQSDAVQSFTKIAPGKPWFLAGGMGVAAGFIILSFYAVIAGWAMKYLFGYVTTQLWKAPAEGYDGYFGNFVSGAAGGFSTVEPLLWQALFMAITVGIVFFGIKKGIERANFILMPLLALLVVGLALYSVSLEGAREGLVFLFSPDWAAFSDPNVYIAALGQAFFSLSIGMGALITYSSYLSQKEKLPGAAGSVITLDTAFAVIAGIMIFPAVFAFGGSPDEGPGLVFITLPSIFESMGFAGVVVGFLFFFLLVAAALSSAMSLLEVVVAFFMRKFAMGRRAVTVLVGVIIFAVGVPSSLGQGLWADVALIGGRDILDSMDFLASNIMLPLGGLLIALFVGWSWNKTDIMRESDFGNTIWGSIFRWVLMFIVPIMILAIFINKISEL